ncbi:MAG: U32 family peptidase, partial [Holdemanella sp.]|nr:U32 family peptidase [Holdemanella sp.]
ELDMKLYINFLRLIPEQKIEEVSSILKICKELDIDGIYFSDEGVLYKAMEIGYEDHLIYQPETLVANSMDVDFYLNQNLLSVSLCHELSLEELLTIASNYSNVEVLVHGYFSILYSRRPLVTNYLHVLKKDSPLPCRFDIIEQTRKGRMPIVQDESGTHVFSEVPIGSYDEIAALKESGIKRFRIDSIFFDDEYTVKVMNGYRNGIVEDTQYSNHWYHQETIKKKGDM